MATVPRANLVRSARNMGVPDVDLPSMPKPVRSVGNSVNDISAGTIKMKAFQAPRSVLDFGGNVLGVIVILTMATATGLFLEATVFPIPGSGVPGYIIGGLVAAKATQYAGLFG